MIDARYALHGITLALMWFGVVDAATAAIVFAVAARADRRAERRSAAFWLALRLLPAVTSIAFVALLFVPSYWRYEPRTVEAFDVWLGAFELAVFAVIGAGFARGCSSWYHASRRTRAWLRIARPIGTAAAIPAYEVPLDTPMMALVGVLRPSLILTRGVVQALTAKELRAAVAHEIGHLRAFDNLKRLAMRAAPDIPGVTRRAALIEASWAAAAEHAADRAAGGDSDARWALASALVKIAKLTPLPRPIAEPISTLVDGGDIASRVRRLLDDDVPAQASARNPRVPVALAAAGVFALSYAPLLRLVHEATELLVNALP